jgi:hypothetical protein
MILLLLLLVVTVVAGDVITKVISVTVVAHFKNSVWILINMPICGRIIVHVFCFLNDTSYYQA